MCGRRKLFFLFDFAETAVAAVHIERGLAFFAFLLRLASVVDVHQGEEAAEHQESAGSHAHQREVGCPRRNDLYAEEGSARQ